MNEPNWSESELNLLEQTRENLAQLTLRSQMYSIKIQIKLFRGGLLEKVQAASFQS